MNETRNDVWYFETTTKVNGELRGFSRQILARPPCHGETIPPTVREACEAFLSDVVEQSDLTDYHAVLAGQRCDWPYRSASYVLSRNGEVVVRSCAIRPIKPEVVAS